MGGETQKLPDQREQIKFGKGWYLQDFNDLVRKCKAQQDVQNENDIIWTSEIDDNLRELVSGYYEKMSEIGFRLLRLVALSLSLQVSFSLTSQKSLT